MTLLLTVFFALLLGGLPIFIALAGSSLAYTHFSTMIPDFVVLHRIAGGVDSFPLIAVPFFILAGNLMNTAGITNRIYDFATAAVGWMHGGLGHVNVVGSVIFAGMSGTAVADAGAWAPSRSRRCAIMAIPTSSLSASQRHPLPSGRSSRLRYPW